MNTSNTQRTFATGSIRDSDEDHLSAIIVNAFFLMHVDINLSYNPDLNNLDPFFDYESDESIVNPEDKHE